MTQEPSILTSIEGRCGRIELNRPRAINALDHEMVGLMQAALDGWRDDPQIATVVISGRGERGLCAGGDIVSIYHDAAGGSRNAVRYWADEYVLDYTIATYPKPVVAIMDGIVLGGGVGISAHASHRVVTERSSIGMPETGIGFVPDVGGSHLLARAPGELGTHLALTAGSVKAGDALALGLADHFVPADRLEDLYAALAEQDANAALSRLELDSDAPEVPQAQLSGQRGWIDECYAGHDAERIHQRLLGHPDPAARAAGELLGSRSPFAVSVALAAIRCAEGQSLAEVLATDLRLTSNFLSVPDFREGVRAQVIDKDRNPRWQPARLADVDPAAVAAAFEPIPEGELILPTAKDTP